MILENLQAEELNQMQTDGGDLQAAGTSVEWLRYLLSNWAMAGVTRNLLRTGTDDCTRGWDDVGVTCPAVCR